MTPSVTPENNPQSRFQIVETLVAAPGSCVTCGGSNGPFIDFGFLAEFHGAVVFCILCAQDCGRSAGLVDRPTFSEEALDAKIIVNALPSLINDFEVDLNASLAKLRNSVDVDFLPSLSGTEVSREPEAEDSESESISSEELGAFSPDSEFISSEGSAGVSSDSSSK